MFRAARILFLAALLISPASTYATASLPAGFAPSAVWLSTYTLVGGDSVELYTVVYNASDISIEGSVAFQIDGETVGAAPFSLSIGESKVRSVEWTTTPGEHELVAVLNTVIDTRTKELTSVESVRTPTTTFTVLTPKPKPTSQTLATAVTPAILTGLTTNPLIASVLGTATNSTEELRVAGETLLSSYISSEIPGVSSDTLKDDSKVLGTSTKNIEGDLSLKASAATAVLPLFAYPALFYPLIIILVLFILWLLTRGLQNPKRRRRR